MRYRNKINEILEEFKEYKEEQYIEVYQEAGMYTILKWGRRISPVMTAKECYKTLQTLMAVL